MGITKNDNRQKRDNDLQSAIMSSEIVKTCYYLLQHVYYCLL